MRKFLTSWGYVSFSGRTLLHRVEVDDGVAEELSKTTKHFGNDTYLMISATNKMQQHLFY